MKNRLTHLLAIVVIATLLLSGCAGGGTTGGGTIKIATQSPLSGGQSATGVDIKNGAELALSQLSGPLTAMGFKVELAAFDDQADPNTGVANAKKIVSDPTILCVVGHYNSGVQIPSSEEYHTAGLANVSPANTNPKVTDRGYLEVSRIVGRDDVQGVVAAQFAKSKGMKSAYVVHDKTAYGQGIAEFFKREFETQGLQVVGFEGTEEKANFDSILTPLIGSNPDVVFFGGIYDQASVLFKQAREKGFMGIPFKRLLLAGVGGGLIAVPACSGCCVKTTGWRQWGQHQPVSVRHLRCERTSERKPEDGVRRHGDAEHWRLRPVGAQILQRSFQRVRSSLNDPGIVLLDPRFDLRHQSRGAVEI